MLIPFGEWRSKAKYKLSWKNLFQTFFIPDRWWEIRNREGESANSVSHVWLNLYKHKGDRHVRTRMYICIKHTQVHARANIWVIGQIKNQNNLSLNVRTGHVGLWWQRFATTYLLSWIYFCLAELEGDLDDEIVNFCIFD